MIKERDIAVLRAVARYYVLNSRQIQRLLFPDDASGRVTRRRLQMLVSEKLLNKQNMLFAHPTSGSIGPVYYPAQKGLEVLIDTYPDEKFRGCSTRPPVFHHVWHWLAVAETHMAIDSAIEGQDDVKLEAWINEYDELIPEDAPPEKKYRLYTLISENPRLVCAPDAAFLLSMKGHTKVFYLEQDRATSGTKQIACSKTPGYVAMNEKKLHRRHFPNATVDSFTVLMVAPGGNRRDALRRAIREKPGAALWRFTTVDDLTNEAVLRHKIWYPAGDEAAGSLVKGESA